MRPGDLPDGSTVSLEWPLTSLHSLLLILLLLLLLLGKIIAHTTDLQEALAVAGSNLRAIVVKLAIIDVILMLRIDWEGSGARIRSLSVSSSTWDRTGSGRLTES